jgi:hypothetical protein
MEKAKKYYFPWNEERLVLEMAQPVGKNHLKAQVYCECENCEI